MIALQTNWHSWVRDAVVGAKQTVVPKALVQELAAIVSSLTSSVCRRDGLVLLQVGAMHSGRRSGALASPRF